MAVLHAEGFETFGLGDDRDALAGAYDCAAASAVDDFEIVEGHAGGQGLAVSFTGPAWALAIGGLTAGAMLIRSFRLQVAELPAADRVLLAYHDYQNDELATWVLTTTGSIELRRGDASGTLLGTTADGVVVAGEWVFLEFKITFHASAGDFELRATPDMDNVTQTVLSGSGANTTETGGVRAWQLWHGASAEDEGWVYDDCVLVDASGATWSDFTGDLELVRLAPVNNNVNQWTRSDNGQHAFEHVDEDAADGDATEVSSNTEGHVESYAFESPPVDRRVAFVAARPVLRKTDAGTRQVKLRVDSMGELAESAAVPLSTSHVRLSHAWETDPNTGQLWTPSRVGVAYFGLSVATPPVLQSAGPFSAGTIVSDNANGGTIPWSSTSAAGSSNDSYANFTGDFFEESEWLKFTNFNIPNLGGTPVGILIELEKRADISEEAEDVTLQLTKDGSSVVGANKAGITASPVWPTSDEYRSYGGQDDLWQTTWTFAELAASTFGFVLSAWTVGFDPNVIRIDHARVTVFYLD